MRSGEVGRPALGSLVGESSFRRKRGLLLRASVILSPCSAALLQEVEEYQDVWWALKSPTRMESFWS